MRSDETWRWLSARAWSRKNSKRLSVWWSGGRPRPSSDVAGRGRPALHRRSSTRFQQGSGWRELTEKDLVIARRGVARSEIRALSGARIGDLVALETWPSDSEIVNLT